MNLALSVRSAHAFFESWEAGDSKKHWKDRLRSVVARRAVEAKHFLTLADHKKHMAEMAKEAWEAGTTMPERIEAFENLTGRSRATAYRYWHELGYVTR